MKRTGRWMVALSWACRAIAAVILLQTLFFKFTAAPESVYIFTKVGEFVHGYAQFLPVEMVQASARIGSGVMELIASVLLLILAATGGAILSHLTFLGIVVQNDGGLLFALATTVVCTSVIALYLHRTQVPVIGKRF
ncbi:MAG: DoxX family protein [Acidobacteria bacterium]|nr:MAG: DoxX family protein [Acidobacteriota bacterium]